MSRDAPRGHTEVRRGARDHIHEIEAMGFTLPLYSKNGRNPFIK